MDIYLKFKRFVNEYSDFTFEHWQIFTDLFHLFIMRWTYFDEIAYAFEPNDIHLKFKRFFNEHSNFTL